MFIKLEDDETDGLGLSKSFDQGDAKEEQTKRARANGHVNSSWASSLPPRRILGIKL
jgi:hypothetical protein